MSDENNDNYILDFLLNMKDEIKDINKEHRSTIGSLSKEVDQCIKNIKTNKETEINILEINDRFVDIKKNLSAPQELKNLKENIKNVLKNDEEKIMDNLNSDEK